MDFGRAPQARIEAMVRAGLWPNRLVVDYLDEAARLRPDEIAITAQNSTTGRTTTLSYRQLQRLSNRIALGLVAHGIERKQVVSCQLPNWWEMTALYLGCERIGAIFNPLVPIFRHRELSYMMRFAESAMVVVPRLFRGFDYPRMIAELRGELPDLRHCLVVDGEGQDSFDNALLARRWEDEMDAAAIFRERRPDPNDVIEVLYTSGTTGEPKGVLHTPNTILATPIAFTGRMGLSARDVVLMPSPMAHQMGFLHGLVMPIYLGAKSVLQDIWSAEVAARLIQDERVTFTIASTPFLVDLTESPAINRYDIRSFSMFATAGAPIPSALVEQARNRLGAAVMAGWGMSEMGTVTTTKPLDPPEKIYNTDGTPIPGSEVRIVDDDGSVMPPGQPGRLEERGSTDFIGYLKRPDLGKRDKDGWFDTGDLAMMDRDGYIRITGRAKDIIIRGGQNIPVVEVENMLGSHPAVRDVAVVAMPDPRLGERACAFVTLRPGHALTFAQAVQFLESKRMARQYFPERLEVLEELPRTPSGKVQKFRLREIAKTLTASR